jgi:hypothetical protein
VWREKIGKNTRKMAIFKDSRLRQERSHDTRAGACMESFTVPLGSPRRIFARQPRRNLGTFVPWLVAILLLAGASAAAGAILAANVERGNVTVVNHVTFAAVK